MRKPIRGPSVNKGEFLADWSFVFPVVLGEKRVQVYRGSMLMGYFYGGKKKWSFKLKSQLKGFQMYVSNS